MSLPKWDGASEVYSRAYRMLEQLASRGGATPAVVTKRGKVRSPGHVAPDLRDLISALDSGDEEAIKGLLMNLSVRYPDCWRVALLSAR